MCQIGRMNLTAYGVSKSGFDPNYEAGRNELQFARFNVHVARLPVLDESLARAWLQRWRIDFSPRAWAEAHATNSSIDI